MMTTPIKSSAEDGDESTAERRARGVLAATSQKRVLAFVGTALFVGTVTLLAVVVFGEDTTRVATESRSGSTGADGSDTRGRYAERPWREDAEMRPDLLRVEPDEAVPGQAVELHFLAETSRGRLFVLEEWVGHAWVLRYFLESTTHIDRGGGPANWVAVEDSYDGGFAWDDVGISGPGPDRVFVPDQAPPGQYRVCTGDAATRQSQTAAENDAHREYCAELTIIEP